MRSLLERKAIDLFDSQGNLQIDSGVLEAFLKVYQYKHGARSLEAVLDMSMLSDSKSFEAAALPPTEQLHLHVDAVQFCRLLVQDAVFDSLIEPLARAIHEKFVQEETKKETEKKPETDANMQPWEKLREDTREENRKQARDIKAKLQAVSCGVIPAGEKGVALFVFTLEEIEIMAIMEHNRWMHSKLDAGWTYAPGKRDDEKKTHPCLLPWEQLTNEEQEKDRQAMQKLPSLLADIGLEVYSLVPEEDRKALEKNDEGENE
jgi:hypothetical protein